MPIGHLPVEHPFQRVSVDLVDYKTLSFPQMELSVRYVLSTIDHLTRFAVLVPVPNKFELAVAKALVEYVFGIFGPPETPH